MRLFAICPRIRKDSSRVVATTAWCVRILFLDAIYRQVVIDPTNKTISIRSRYLWLICRNRIVRFAEIQGVTYGYEDMSPASLLSYAHDSYDWFTVGLRLNDNSEMHLFNFIGEGTFANNGPFPDWLYWEQFTFDISGNQEKQSRLFVDVLSKMIGVSVVPPSGQ